MPYSYVMQYLQAVHMPFFMLIAGYFAAKPLDLSPGGVVHYWRDKLVRLVLPAILWWLLLTTLVSGTPSLRGIFFLEYWFTPTLFIYFGLFYAQRLLIDGVLQLSRSKGNRWIEATLHLAVTVGLAFWAEGRSFQGHPILSPFQPVVYSFDCLYPYFVLGYLLKRLELLDHLKTPLAGAISFVVLVVSLGIFRHQATDVPYLGYGLFHVCRLIALASFAFLVYGMTALTERGGRVSHALVFLGQWSLPIYLTHYFFIPPLYELREYFALIPDFRRLGLEMIVYSLGTLITLLPTLSVIWLLKRNPYLDYAFYGELGRLKK